MARVKKARTTLRAAIAAAAQILSFLDARTRLGVKRVCKRWKSEDVCLCVFAEDIQMPMQALETVWTLRALSNVERVVIKSSCRVLFEVDRLIGFDSLRELRWRGSRVEEADILLLCAHTRRLEILDVSVCLLREESGLAVARTKLHTLIVDRVSDLALGAIEALPSLRTLNVQELDSLCAMNKNLSELVIREGYYDKADFWHLRDCARLRTFRCAFNRSTTKSDLDQLLPLSLTSLQLACNDRSWPVESSGEDKSQDGFGAGWFVRANRCAMLVDCERRVENFDQFLHLQELRLEIGSVTHDQLAAFARLVTLEHLSLDCLNFRPTGLAVTWLLMQMPRLRYLKVAGDDHARSQAARDYDQMYVINLNEHEALTFLETEYLPAATWKQPLWPKLAVLRLAFLLPPGSEVREVSATLQALKALNELHITHDLHRVQGCTRKELVHESPELLVEKELCALRHARALRVLRYDNPDATHLRYLAKLAELVHLELGYKSARLTPADYAALATLPGLVCLAIHDANMTESKAKELALSSSLRELVLPYEGAFPITAMAHLVAIASLRVLAVSSIMQRIIGTQSRIKIVPHHTFQSREK